MLNISSRPWCWVQFKSHSKSQCYATLPSGARDRVIVYLFRKGSWSSESIAKGHYSNIES